MALRSNSWVEMTPTGEKAWRESDLPLDERRLLSACHQRISIGELYQKTGDHHQFEDRVQSLLRKGYLVFKDAPTLDKALGESLEIADEAIGGRAKTSGLRDLLGKLQKSTTTSTRTSVKSTSVSHESQTDPSEPEILQPPPVNRFSLWSKPEPSEIAESLDDFAKQLMESEDDSGTDATPPSTVPTWFKPSEATSSLVQAPSPEPLQELDERLLRLGEMVEEKGAEGVRSSVETAPPVPPPTSQPPSFTQDEEDEDEDESWLDQAPPSFMGATSVESSVPSSPKHSKLQRSLSKLGALEEERASAAAKGAAYKEKKEQEAREKHEKLASPEIRERVRKANETQEAQSFKSMSEQLKALRRQQMSNTDNKS